MPCLVQTTEITDAIIESKEIEMTTDFVLVKEETEVQKVIRQGQYMEMKRKEKAFRILCLSLVPLCFRIGLELGIKKAKSRT